jgi:hypothetical protein
MPRETIEVVETRIVPVDRAGMLSIEAPNGTFIQAPFEVWIAALLGDLDPAHQGEVCERVARLTRAHNAASGAIIDVRQASAFPSLLTKGS